MTIVEALKNLVLAFGGTASDGDTVVEVLKDVNETIGGTDSGGDTISKVLADVSEAVEDNVAIPEGKKTITSTAEVDVKAYATAQVVDSNLTAQNIKKDVSVLGITGEYEGGGVSLGKEVVLVSSQSVPFESGSGNYVTNGDAVIGNPNGIVYDEEDPYSKLPNEITVNLDGTDYVLPIQHGDGFDYYGAEWVSETEVDFTDYPISVDINLDTNQWWFSVASGASHTIAVTAVLTEQRFVGYGDFDPEGLESVFFENLCKEVWNIHITSVAVIGTSIYSDIGAGSVVTVLPWTNSDGLVKQLQISLTDGVDETYQIYKLVNGVASYEFTMELPVGKTASVTGDIVMSANDNYRTFTCTGSGTITIADA